MQITKLVSAATLTMAQRWTMDLCRRPPRDRDQCACGAFSRFARTLLQATVQPVPAQPGIAFQLGKRLRSPAPVRFELWSGSAQPQFAGELLSRWALANPARLLGRSTLQAKSRPAPRPPRPPAARRRKPAPGGASAAASG